MITIWVIRVGVDAGFDPVKITGARKSDKHLDADWRAPPSMYASFTGALAEYGNAFERAFVNYCAAHLDDSSGPVVQSLPGTMAIVHSCQNVPDVAVEGAQRGSRIWLRLGGVLHRLARLYGSLARGENLCCTRA